MRLHLRGLALTIAALATVAVVLPLAALPGVVPPPASSPMATPATPSAVLAGGSSSGPAGAALESSPRAVPSPRPTPTPTAIPTATPTPTPGPVVAVVPIVGFWSSDRSMSPDQLGAALAGGDRRFRTVLVSWPDLTALTAALDVRPGPNVRELAPEAVIAAVQGRSDVLGFVRANDVRPSVRALGVGGRTLFGNARIRSLDAWPLTIGGTAPPVAASTGTASTGTAASAAVTTPAFDPAATWTLVAGGDVMNDREVYRRTVLLGRGPDFPWNGGTATIVRRSCCTGGLPTVTARRTGNAGTVAALFRDADLALVNHEGPAPNRSTYHPTGLAFTFDPRLEAGLAHAGVDVVSLANNHIRNAGSSGVLQTIRAVRAAGIVPVGAGRNLKTSRKPVWFTVDGVRVAVLAYDAVDPSAAGATRTRAGAAPLRLGQCRADIRAARSAGADTVIVVPHWGTEYTSRPTAAQRRQARALIAAGADVILGAHSHWAGALEAVGRGVVVYSMGDFIFDLPRSEQTDEGLIVELTFVGRRLAQVDLHPTIELDRSQPNLLDPAGDGRVVLDRVRRASKWLDW